MLPAQLSDGFARGRSLILLCAFALAAIGLALEPARVAPASAQGTGQDDDPPEQEPTQQIMPSSLGNADSNNSMIAVTGTDLTGASILYLVDTVNRQIAVYQASGGTPGTQGIKFVGARRIDLDLRVEGWNDKSEHSYADLKRQFEANSSLPAEPVK
jgi:hypothetical protein